MQFVRVPLNSFEILAQRSRYCLFHRVWLLCHSVFYSLRRRSVPTNLVRAISIIGRTSARSTPSRDSGISPLPRQRPCRTPVPNLSLTPALHSSTPALPAPHPAPHFALALSTRPSQPGHFEPSRGWVRNPSSLSLSTRPSSSVLPTKASAPFAAAPWKDLSRASPPSSAPCL